MDKKIIFLDIDGTLTEPGTNVPPASAMEAVRKAQANGHMIFLCTGRNYGMFQKVYKLGFDGAIGSGGGIILHGEDVIYDCPMTEEQRVLALNAFKEAGIVRTIECRLTSYSDENFAEVLAKTDNENPNSELLRWKRIISNLDIHPISEYKDDPIYKVVFMSPSEEALETPRKLLENDFKFIIQEPDVRGITSGELVNKAFDKGKAVIRVCQHFGIDPNNSFGFGDSMNDLEMIEVVGHSVAMENGSKALKEIADYVCPSVSDDGLYKAFQKMGLID